MQDQEKVQGLDHDRVQLVLLGRKPKAEAQEVLHEVHGVVRVEHGLADALLQCVGGDDRHLGQEPVGGHFHMLGVEGVQGILVEGGEGGYCRGEYRHRVRVTREAAEEALQLFMQQGVAADPLVKGVQLGGRRQVAVDQQVGNFQEAGVLGQLLDRVPAVPQDSGIAVDVGDGRSGGRGVHETGVKGNGACLLQQFGNVIAFVSFYNLDAREFEFAARVAQGCAGGLSHGVSS
ncbi:hypothetical protein D9M72_472000 [compost metagenome]